MKTIDGKKMTHQAATEPIGSALRIAPGFTATTRNDDTGIETTVDVLYYPDEGRYIVGTIVSRGFRPGFDEAALKRAATYPILQAAVPHCVAVKIDGEWVTVADLLASKGRIIPERLVEQIIKPGTRTARLEVIQMLYGASALAGLPPVKLVQFELGVPYRTASDWISKARTAGYLKGMSYTTGRQADD